MSMEVLYWHGVVKLPPPPRAVLEGSPNHFSSSLLPQMTLITYANLRDMHRYPLHHPLCRVEFLPHCETLDHHHHHRAAVRVHAEVITLRMLNAIVVGREVPLPHDRNYVNAINNTRVRQTHRHTHSSFLACSPTKRRVCQRFQSRNLNGPGTTFCFAFRTNEPHFSPPIPRFLSSGIRNMKLCRPLFTERATTTSLSLSHSLLLQSSIMRRKVNLFSPDV